MLTAPAITAIIVSITTLVIGLFTFLNNYHRKANRLVLALTLVASVSLLAQNLGEVFDPDRVVMWARVDSCLSMLGNALLLLLVCNFPRQLFSRRTELIYGIISAAVIVISATPFMIADGTSHGGVVSLVTGPLMPLYYIADTIYTLLVIPVLALQYRRGRKMDRLRVMYLLVGGGILGVLISLLGLWLPIFFHVYHAVDYVPFVALLGLGLLTYDIVALRLFSIRLVVARSFAYLLLLLCIAGGYYLMAMQAGQLIFGGIEIPQINQLYQVVVALGLAFLFQPLRRFFEKITDRLFYRDHYDTQQVLNGFSNILVSEQEITTLLQRSLEFICAQLHIQSGHVSVYSKGQLFATANQNTKADFAQATQALGQLTANVVVAAELGDDDPLRTAMETYKIHAAVKLASQGENVGVVLLGDKLSGDIYTAQDIGALEIMSQELAVAVQNARAYRQLQVAQAELKQTDEMKSEFIALSSHNLRTPLTTIKLIADALTSSKLTPEANKYVGMLAGVSNELGDFIEELLTISQLEAGEKFATTFDTMTAEDLLQPLTDQAKTEASAKNIALTVAFQKPGLQFKANPSHLRIAIRNVLSNAIKFTSEGSVAVSVGQDDGHCYITVTDTGIGISPDELKRLFTKFHRGTSFMRYDYAGAGVGLYLAKLVIEEHGGQIQVQSKPQAGTTVTIILPLAQSAVAATAPAPAMTPVPES